MANQETIPVKIKQGRLRGEIVYLSKNLSGKKYFSFKGIPYAQPPIGDLRFKAPVKVKSWSGVKDAFTEGPCSVQGTRQMIGDEDCLYLNVYVPDYDKLDIFQTMPVMVWIHGGSFVSGSGNAAVYGPEFFMKKGNVILVTINYRLGPLGFIYLGTERIPGNAGLKDLLFALHWVQENILRFRGDPDNITIFGQSSGAAMIHYLLFSPQSNGLFHRAILQSGNIFNTMIYLDKNISKSRTIKLARILGCNSENLSEISDFLQQVPAYTLTERIKDVVVEAERLLNPIFNITYDTSDAFLPRNHYELLKVGEFNKVPILIGATSQEGLFIDTKIKSPKCLWSYFEENFSQLTSIPFHITPEKKTDIIAKVRKFYFNSNPIDCQNFVKLYDLISDQIILYGIKYFVEESSKVASSCPIYLYLFDYEGQIPQLIQRSVPGSQHSDDLGYLFRQHILPEPKANSPDFFVMEKMINIWTNFATNGNPTENLPVYFEPFNKNHTFLRVSSNLTIEEDFFTERINFWKQIFEEYAIFNFKS